MLVRGHRFLVVEARGVPLLHAFARGAFFVLLFEIVELRLIYHGAELFCVFFGKVIVFKLEVVLNVIFRDTKWQGNSVVAWTDFIFGILSQIFHILHRWIGSMWIDLVCNG